MKRSGSEKKHYIKKASILLAALLVLQTAGCALGSSNGVPGSEAGVQGQQAEKSAGSGSGEVPVGETASETDQGQEESTAGISSFPAEEAGAASGETGGAARTAAEESLPEIPEKPVVRDDGGVFINVFAMDTYMTLLAYGDKAEEAVQAAAKEIHDLDDMLSTGKETSEVSLLNKAGGGKPSEEVEKLISESLYLAEKTEGLFDIAVYPVMKVWGFPTKEYRVPDKKEIDSALKLADTSSITLITREDVKEAQKARKKAEEEAARKRKAAEEAIRKAEAEAASKKDNNTGSTAETAGKPAAKINEEEFTVKAEDYPSEPSVRFGIKGMEIDLGGIAKGYTGDKVGEVFRRYNIRSGIISLGGNVQTFGSKENGKPWRVAIQNPDSDLEYLGVLDVEDLAVVTSGGYERYFEEKGVRYHHIIDPRTGYPADSGLISATIVCKDGILADGLSTSLFIMGKEEAEKFWKNSGLDFDYILEDENGTLYVTEGISNSLTTDAKTVIVK